MIKGLSFPERGARPERDARRPQAEPARSLTCPFALTDNADSARNPDSLGYESLDRRSLDYGSLKGRGWNVNPWSAKTLKSLILPGGILLLVASVVFQGAFGPIPAAAIDFYYYAVFAAGLLLAWRFHSSRLLFAFLTLLLAHRAVEFFSDGRIATAGPGRIAFEAVAFLLPLNFIAFSVLREWGLVVPALVPRLGLLFFESVFVAVICRPGETTAPAFLHPGFPGAFSARMPGLALLAFAAAVAVLLLRFLLHGKPTESGMLWTVLAAFLSFRSGGVGPTATAYIATAGLILVSSIIENSYLLAYHDELTTLPARRAFNDALLRLEDPYAVAVVDIDHFKKFNDTYGHETGDQVLRLVAAKLADVTGGGRAYRVGGEEFSILFPGKSVKDVLSHLELLRSAVEASQFQVRGGQERRSPAGARQSRRQNGGSENRGYEDSPSRDSASQQSPSHNLFARDAARERRSADRRTESRTGARRTASSRKKTRSAPDNFVETADRPLSVTVSIGVAGPDAKARAPEQIIEAADKALYRAKQSGRNRVESGVVLRPSKPKRNIA
jgi:diguanylate cyclase (GGDEF)-like protein